MHNQYDRIPIQNERKLSILFQSILVGALTGCTIVFYRLALIKAETISYNFYHHFQEQRIFILPLFVGLVIIGLFVSFLTRKNPMICGSGIPQVKGILMGLIRQNWLSTLIYKLIGGILAIMGGLSLGRAGPSIQLGASLAEGVGKKTGRSRFEKKILLASGASAGLAAAFDAPLAGVIFAFEEVYKYFSPLILLSTMGAAITADLISKRIFGLEPVFQLEVSGLIGLDIYWLLIPLGIVLGVAGALYNTCLLSTLKAYNRLPLIFARHRIVIPFLAAGVAGLCCPDILGSGHHMMNLLVPDSGIRFLCFLLLLKFLFSVICFGSGAPGGIFFPLLVLGAAIGAVFAKICILYLGFPAILFNNLMILAMAGLFSAIVRAPITGIVLIVEMTGSLSHMLSLTVVSMIAFVVADHLKSEPIYDSLLELFAEKHGPEEEKEEHTHKIVMEIVVRHNSDLENQKVGDIPWPGKSLLVSVRRRNKEFIPNRETVLLAGDYLFILTDINSEWNNRKSLEKMNDLS